MYFSVDNHEFEERELKLRCPVGIAAFALTLASCVRPLVSALQASKVPQP
jgi:hypothetical protein